MAGSQKFAGDPASQRAEGAPLASAQALALAKSVGAARLADDASANTGSEQRQNNAAGLDAAAPGTGSVAAGAKSVAPRRTASLPPPSVTTTLGAKPDPAVPPPAQAAARDAGPPIRCRVTRVSEAGTQIKATSRSKITFELAKELCVAQPHPRGQPYQAAERGIVVKCLCD